MKSTMPFVLLIIIFNTLSASGSNIYTQKNSNVIHLIAEKHDDPDCIRLRDSLRELSKKRAIILAREGLDLNAENAFREFGLEEKYIQGTYGAWEYFSMFTAYKIIKDIDSLNQLNPAKEITTILKSVKKVLMQDYFYPPIYIIQQGYPKCFIVEEDPNYRLSENKPICSALSNLITLEKSSYKDFKKEIKKLTKNNSFETPFFLNIHKDISNWINLFKDSFILNSKKALEIHKDDDSVLITIEKVSNCIDKYETYLKLNLEKLELQELYDTLVDFVMDNNEILPLKDSFSLNVRNKIFLKNIINIFNENKPQKKSFYAIIGYNHIPFLYEELLKEGYEVELNQLGEETYQNYLNTKREL